MPYRRLRRLLPALGGAYLVLGFCAAAAPGFEVFPFFCWFLFPITPNVEERFALSVHEIGGRRFEEPVEFQSLDVIEDPHAMDVWFSVQALGQAVVDDNAREAERIRRRLEANFIPSPSRYTVDQVTYDPIERWRQGTVRSRTTLAVFTSSTGCTRSPWAR